MYISLKFQNNFNRKALIDTGACANALPRQFYEKLKEIVYIWVYIYNKQPFWM